MPLRFEPINYELLELAFLGGVLLANTLLVLGGYFLRKDDLNLRFTDYLLTISLGLFLFSIFDFFLPDAVYFSSTGSDPWEDVRYGFTYDFLRFECIELALLVTLGMSFVLIAITNRQIVIEQYLFFAGIGLILASFFSLVNWGIYYFLQWLWPQDFLIYYDFFVPWQLINLLLSITAFGLFSLFSVQYKQKYLSVFGILTIFLLLFGLWDFIVTFEVLT